MDRQKILEYLRVRLKNIAEVNILSNEEDPSYNKFGTVSIEDFDSEEEVGEYILNHLKDLLYNSKAF